MSVDTAAATCRKCEVRKPFSEFHRCANVDSGYRAECKECASLRNREWYQANKDKRREISRRWAKANPERVRESAKRRYAENREEDRAKKRLHLYGITQEQFDELLLRQSGHCAICADAEPGGRGGWHVDHDHDSGTIRGLLCHRCNTALGLFRDNGALLESARRYLEAGVPCQ